MVSGHAWRWNFLQFTFVIKRFTFFTSFFSPAIVSVFQTNLVAKKTRKKKERRGVRGTEKHVEETLASRVHLCAELVESSKVNNQINLWCIIIYSSCPQIVFIYVSLWQLRICTVLSCAQTLRHSNPTEQHLTSHYLGHSGRWLLLGWKVLWLPLTLTLINSENSWNHPWNLYGWSPRCVNDGGWKSWALRSTLRHPRDVDIERREALCQTHRGVWGWVCSGHHNRRPQTGSLKWQKLLV